MITLRYHYPEDRVFFFFNRVISVMSVLLRKSTLSISVSTGEPLSMESEIVRVVSLSTIKISEITRLKIRSSWSGYLKTEHTKYIEPFSGERG